MTEQNVWLASYVSSMMDYSRLNGQLKLIEDSDRQTLEKCVEKTLVHYKSLLSHLKVLTNLLGAKLSEKTNLESDKSLADKVYKEGLSSMSDEELASFITDPILMLSVSNEIERTVPSYWMDVMDREKVSRPGMRRKYQPISKG